MPEPKWTKGPWRVRDQDGPPINDVLSESGDLLATAYPEHYRLSDPRRASSDAILRSYAVAEANARLVAAAPNLYRACEGLKEALDRAMDYIGNGYQPQDIVAEAREARDQADLFMAQARGETDA